MSKKTEKEPLSAEDSSISPTASYSSSQAQDLNIQKPYLYQPEQDFENGDFSSSHYNKIVSDPRSYRNSSNRSTLDANVLTIKGGFDESSNAMAAASIKAMPITNTRIQRKESMLSQSLRNNRANFTPRNNTVNDTADSFYTKPNVVESINSPSGVIGHTGANNSASAVGSMNSSPAPSKCFKPRTISNNSNPNLMALSHTSKNTARPSAFVDAENPDPATVDIVSRHLVHDDAIDNSYSNSIYNDPDNASSVLGGDEFDSLQLQGGDITREIYNWKRDHTRAPRRVKSFNTLSRTGSVSSFSNFNSNFNNSSVGGSETDVKGWNNPNKGAPNSFPDLDLNINEILLPGGFRRSFIAQKNAKLGKKVEESKPAFFTRNFIEFLTLYGHFAGEEFGDEDEETGEDEEFEDEARFDSRGPQDFTEHDRLLQAGPGYKAPHVERNVSTFKAVLLLLKAFIGTGILFLPKGFYNGGILFCVATLVFFSCLSYWCFLLLIDARVKSNVSSFGDIGDKYFGSKMRLSILTSIVLSQIGFASAYIVFVAQNLRSVLIAITGDDVSIPLLIFVQLVIFIPLSLTRKIAKLSGTALVADFFILLGIIYIYYNCTFEIATHHIKHVEFFNPNDWTVFIGTAVFTYEGIGLLIPIQESMQKPSKFTGCLGGVMVGITFIFISIGSICYLAYGDNVQTVILNNFPQDSSTVNIIQLLYALAILLSTPLQLFPAIRILENGLFGSHKSGKYNLHIKWKKNLFRVCLVVFTSLVSWVGNSDLDKFVALIGSFACIPLIYIYPPLLHIKSYVEEVRTGNQFLQSRNQFLNNHFACYFNVAVTLFGICIMAYTSVDTMKSWIF